MAGSAEYGAKKQTVEHSWQKHRSYNFKDEQ